ncbi:MAG TPA: ABC transporter ATP-binding protein [Conexibacter sp.]|jgi:ABC-type branched-subunit amino acid transport system ATPase component
MALEIDDVNVSFGSVRAVAGVTLKLEAGERLGLVGPNGSGKSTLVNAISGIVKGGGRIALDGSEVRAGSALSAARCGISRTYQSPQTFADVSCLDNVMLGLDRDRTNGLFAAWFLRRATDRRERRRVSEALALLDQVGLADAAESPASMLTFGQQQMLGLARALAAKPSVLLLDEPVAGLNTEESKAMAKVLAAVNEQGVSLLLIEHRMDFVASLCPRVAVLAAGSLIADGPHEQVFADPQVIDAYLGSVSHA